MAAFALLLLIPTVVAMLTCDGILNGARKKIQQQCSGWKKAKVIIPYGAMILVLAIYFCLVLISTFQSYGITLEYLGSADGFGDIFSVGVVVALIESTVRKSLSNSSQRRYLDCVHQIVEGKDISDI